MNQQGSTANTNYLYLSALSLLFSTRTSHVCTSRLRLAFTALIHIFLAILFIPIPTSSIWDIQFSMLWMLLRQSEVTHRHQFPLNISFSISFHHLVSICASCTHSPTASQIEGRCTSLAPYDYNFLTNSTPVFFFFLFSNFLFSLLRIELSPHKRSIISWNFYIEARCPCLLWSDLIPPIGTRRLSLHHSTCYLKVSLVLQHLF